MTINSPMAICCVSLAALGAAFLAQYWGGLVPCELCLAQRWPYVVTAVIGLAGAFLNLNDRQRAGLVGLAGLVFLVGAGIAIYHAGFEYGWWNGPTACTAEGGTPKTLDELRRMLAAQPFVACNQPAWTFYGISMAGFNALASLVFAAASTTAALKLWRKSA
jgi:disulfide bond formation protein DsbB